MQMEKCDVTSNYTQKKCANNVNGLMWICKQEVYPALVSSQEQDRLLVYKSTLAQNFTIP